MGFEKGKMVALVTAGYKNLGMYISRELKEAGYKVVATYRSNERKAVEFSKRYDIPVYPAELSEKGEVQALFAWIEANHGSIGVVVNNASSFPTGPLRTMPVEDFEDAFKSSIFASNLIIKRAIPMMKDIRGGRIINIGMAGAGEIRSYLEVAAHASAKAAFSILTLSWANELREDKITVNMISPGIIDYQWRTDSWRDRMRKIAPSGELTAPGQIASAVRFIAERPDVTGRIIEVDPEFKQQSI
ncbi:MAG: SDR family oxidoreductase [Candidatus Thermoplasmatota archaeon]|nr:SDR family oxidoreductase [Candidatus Thermoplasmatota archaeon]